MKGIMFKPEMQKAAIEGRKTQTRRTGGLKKINERPETFNLVGMEKDPDMCVEGSHNLVIEIKKGKGLYAHFRPKTNYRNIYIRAKYQPGEIVYLKEPFKAWEGEMGTAIFFLDESHSGAEGWQNKMFMPARYARHFIEIISIRVERLKDISKWDAVQEGLEMDVLFEKYACYQCLTIGHTGSEICEDGFHKSPVDSFASLWRSINGFQSWNENPWVWVYEFDLLENVHSLEEAVEYQRKEVAS